MSPYYQSKPDWPHLRLSLAEVLDNIRHALRGNTRLENKNTSAMAFGVGTHMGCEVSWTFIWRPDGAFYEEVRSSHLTYKWGFDGGSDSQCWEVDPSGVSKVLERDDHEASLLGALIKGGGWLVPELAAQRLEVELEGDSRHCSSPKQLWRQYVPHLDMPPVATTISGPQQQPHVAAAAAVGEPGWQQQQQWDCQQGEQQLGVQLLQQQLAANQQQQQQQQQWQPQQDPQLAAAGQQQQQWRNTSNSSSSSSSSRAQPAPVVAAATYTSDTDTDGPLSDTYYAEEHDKTPPVFIVIKLKGGRMLARLEVDGDTWQVVNANHPLCSETEVWRYSGWNNWRPSSGGFTRRGVPDVFFPREVEHVLFPGCSHKYTTLGCKVRSEDIHKAYQLPASPPVPIDAQYLDIYSQRVPVWQTTTGHLLAECHINGKRAGWMILDTGASGFVIEPGVADQYELPTFGDLRIAGVAGKIKTRFRRARQLRIGPLLLSDPVLMEMRASKLVQGFHDRVVGIAGYDVFRRCRMTLPCHKTREGLVKATSCMGKPNELVEMLLQRPQLIKDPGQLEEGYIWQPLVMIASLPHIELEFVSPGTGARHSSLFLVDTGAGGTEVMFHSRAARELKLLQDQRALYDPAYGTTYVSGVDDGKSTSHSSPQVAVQSGKLPEIIIRGQAGSNPQACGSLVLKDVAALYSKTGGLDISLYSAGMVCIDLLSRMQVVLDYPNKRIGWKVPPQQQQQEGVGVGAAAAVAAASSSSSSSSSS
ncbi:hypothetical protein OEZ85_005860 [Tetradesmus obliquus]|uniref:Peptidase A1 domain-containing protein n=1 Tax=Tetradesmus obliquus TaxID=3088 RepID=A0ABY8UEQ7_TETOB|nr:hypothetical protein OEZ85_005860 [Tetradesmus obliquus]